MMTNEEYWFWLCNIKGIYQHDIKKLLYHFKDPKEIYAANAKTLAQAGILNKNKIIAILSSKGEKETRAGLAKIREKNIKFIYPDSDLYPERLRCLEDMPYSLYVLGNLPSEDLMSVGIVGARSCTGYGRDCAEKIAFRLAQRDVQIISGLAVGIDSAASRGALRANGISFAILGSGIDVIYPKENIGLYYDIIESGGGIISEYPMGTPPIAWQFPHRNRLIAAFSDVLTVIEAAQRSGSLTTASHMLDIGKDVYALPGRIYDAMSVGCNSLIADGAGMIYDINEFTEHITVMYHLYDEDLPDENECSQDNENAKIKQTSNKHTGTLMKMHTYIKKEYSEIYDKLEYEPLNVSMIAEKTGLKVEKIIEGLTQLELEGMVVHISGGYYMKS